MTLQIGTILIAKEDRFMNGETFKPWVIKGNSYKIIRYRSHEDDYMIIDEQGDEHFIGMDYINQHFTIKRYTLTDLQTRTDIMVRIENEEEAKKLGNKWYNTHYFSDELLYGHIKGVKEIIYLEADELEGRTLVPSIDLIDLEEKEESKVVESHHVKQLESIDEIDLEEKVVNECETPAMFIAKLESEIARLKEENEELKVSNQSERTRMAWELYVSGFNHGIADKWTIDECFRTAEIFLNHAKSKEVGNGK